MTSILPIYLDCDTGIDDALALAYLLADPTIELVGIGSVSGNVSAERGAHNTLALLESAGRTDIEVAVGAHDPLAGTFKGGAPHVHGADGVGGTAREVAHLAVSDLSAVDLMAQKVRANPGTLCVVAIGPLTNLAHFVREYPELVGSVGDVVVMGGAFERAGNITPLAEANIHNDPEAAAIVFDAEWHVTVIPLDITMRHTLTEAHVEQLREIPGAVPRQLAEMLGTYLDFYQPIYGARECAMHDPLAAMVAAGAHTVSATLTAHQIEVLLEGDQRGRTQHHVLSDQDAAAAARRVVIGVDGDVPEGFMARLAAWEWPA